MQLLSAPPSIEAAELARSVAPNAQIWRQQAEERKREIEALRLENEQLQAEIALLQAEIENAGWYPFEATAYTADCMGCIGITKTGINVKDTEYYEDKRIVAVDPRIIPLGSTLEVQLANGTQFKATAQDIGGLIKGRIIDVLVENEDTAKQFGRQAVSIRMKEGV
ncbi:3D domain-containing protein [Bacillus chungangensis]|uniref:3D domain-containing protein n=1 Tax=Bacillus chungangensis TaxID=587633 RepID=UPI0027D8349D|nr:3D domain-containing protein [Bacillus chungangensis]